MKDLMENGLTDEALAGISGGNDGMGISSMNVTTEDWADTVMTVINAAGANVREAPSMEGRILFTIQNNTMVTVNGKTSNGWYRINASDPLYGGECAGYILGTLLGFAAGPSAEPFRG